MKTLSSILILCVAFTFSNAQDIAVNAETAPGASFEGYRTFSLVDRDDASANMDRDHKDHDTDRADGTTTGSGYGTQGATGTTTDDQRAMDRDDEGMTDTQEPMDRDDEGMTDTQEPRDRDQGMTDQEGTMGQTGTAGDQGTMGEGTTGQDQGNTGDQGMTNDQGTMGQQGTTGQQGTYGTTGDHQKSQAKMNKKAIKEAIKTEMESRGYTYTESNPDLLVNFSVFEGESDFVMGQDQNTYSAWGPLLGQDQQVSIEEGTIVVHLVDAEKNELVYQAMANAPSDGDQETANQDQVHEVVSKIFEEIPETNR